MIETERKFLVKSLLPDFSKYPAEKIIQGYISTLKDKTQVRLRKIGRKHFLAIKTKVGQEMQRLETEVRITASQLDFLWPTVGTRIIRKTRYYIPHGPYVLELDFYYANLDGLITVEVEFPSLKEAVDFIPPDWVGREITNDPSYGNRYLADFGPPFLR